MSGLRIAMLSAVAACLVAPSVSKASAQIAIEIGAAPDCPYGYYDTTPYGCAPYGYYGSEWFNGGVFIGAGPWFHGASDFHGRVNNRMHPEHGYAGPAPARGEKAEPSRSLVKVDKFKGNETRDGRGHTSKR